MANREDAERRAAKRLAALKSAASDFQLAGQLTLLAEDALWLAHQFNGILAENSTSQNRVDLSRPLARATIYLDLGAQPEVLSWQRLRLMGFRDRYNAHRAHVVDCSLSAFESGVLEHEIPNDLGPAEITRILTEHRTSLVEKARQLMEPYAEVLRGGAA
jgi:hypothetical protein